MNFNTLISNIISSINVIVRVIIPATVIVFMYGLYGYMSKGDDESKRKESIQYIFAGLIGLFVMLSFWGFVEMLAGTFSFSFGIPKIK